MNLSKSLVVAKADIKMAMNYKYVKFGVLGMGAMGPLFSVLSVPMIYILDPNASSYIEFILPYISSMLAMFAIIPAALISANSFVGEREQNTLEPLLCTPLTDMELLVGKSLSAFIPSILILVFGTLITEIASNILLFAFGFPMMLIPDMPGLFLVFASGPPMIFVVVFVMIIISGRVSRVYEAYQVSGVSVLVYIFSMLVPTMFIGSSMPFGQVIWFTNILTFMISILLLLITSYLALRMFNRDRMITQI